MLHPDSRENLWSLIGNKPMIQRVYEQARKSLETVMLQQMIREYYDAVRSFGGKAIMTSADHQSGTDRCAEAVSEN